MLTLPESPGLRTISIVWTPAVSAPTSTDRFAHVSQLAVVGIVSVIGDPPSITRLSVRVVSCPSPPRLLA